MNKKTLVFGASENTSHYSNMVIHKLLSFEHGVVAIGAREGIIHGINITTELLEYIDLDTITLYINPKRQVEYYDYIVLLKPKRVIFNPGTENPELYSILKENSIEFEVACTLVLLSTNQY